VSDRASSGPVVGDLRVEVDLDATVDGDPVRIRTGDGRIEVFAERLGVLRELSTLREALPSPVGDAVKGVPTGIHVGGVEVARIDPGVPPGALSRALGVAPARVDVGGVARAALGLGGDAEPSDGRD